jgi:aspartyl/glutamyl-tRNA(Asn/Gln) amidotransferase C subunit
MPHDAPAGMLAGLHARAKTSGAKALPPPLPPPSIPRAMTMPPPIDRALMQHLANLARLHVPAERAATLRQRLERIVVAFSALQPADGFAAPPETPLGLRPDVPERPLAPADVLANAPRQAAGSFVVPRVVDA